jgi:small subunit ribosomal protein S8e
MGIARDTLHKHRATGAKRKVPRSKRKFELGRQPSNTRIGARKVTTVRVRGGATKFRALRLDHGNFAWASEHTTHKTRLLVVSYNAVSNRLVSTNTLVKGAIIQVDATPFKQWYEKHYGVTLGKPAIVAEGAEPAPEVKLSHAVQVRQKTRKLEPALDAAFKTGRLLARIASRPGQVGRADGYILEGEELAFYSRKLAEKKKKGTVAAK